MLTTVSVLAVLWRTTRPSILSPTLATRECCEIDLTLTGPTRRMIPEDTHFSKRGMLVPALGSRYLE